MSTLQVRPERPADVSSVRAVNLAAFPSAAEAELVDRLREACPDLLSLVAEDDAGDVVGHILFSPVRLERGGSTIMGMGLAPMAVRPDRQRRGIGALLVREGLRQLDQQGCAYVVVLGHPDYYPRFGFQPASRRGVRPQWSGIPDDVFMLRVQDEAALSGGGDLYYRPEFDNDELLEG